MTNSNPESRIILLLGKNGQLGGELQKTLAPLGKLVAMGFEDLDLSHTKEIRETVQRIAPHLIVNAAAYTAVDKAEGEPERAMAINGTAPAVLAEEAKRLGAALVHYSTDYVYDGVKKGPYTEKDKPNPLNMYGKSKLAGDQAIQSPGIPYFIFRTSWIYGLQGENFLLTVMRLAKEREELRMIDDQIGAPTWCRFLARSTANILAQTLTDSSPYDMSHILRTSGLYHMTCSGKASWFKFAQAILEAANISNPPRLVPIPTIEYPTPALRPKNSVLSNEKLKTSFGLISPNWENALCVCLKENSPL